MYTILRRRMSLYYQGQASKCRLKWVVLRTGLRRMRLTLWTRPLKKIVVMIRLICRIYAHMHLKLHVQRISFKGMRMVLTTRTFEFNGGCF